MSWRKEEFEKIVEQLPLGVAITEPAGAIEYLNAYLRDLLGVDCKEAIGAPLARFIPADHASAPNPATVRPTIGEKRLRIRSGELRDIVESVCALRAAGGRIIHYLHVIQDLRTQHLDNLSILAFYDSLTGLPNRNLLSDRIEKALLTARRKRTAFALLYIDIDHFKDINDTFGHEAGDELLRQFALRLAHSLRRNDSVGRWGGDEFVALLEDIDDSRGVARIGRQLAELCDAPYCLADRPRRITLSIGISFYPRDGEDLATLLRAADRAMYAVKMGGRNGYHVAEPATAAREYGSGKFTAAGQNASRALGRR
ncbi:MAG TPA: diguanylate cyclase [Burkholderiales bacterium]|nr:diguanylate cyclase [Burkholderiales bacterium]